MSELSELLGSTVNRARPRKTFETSPSRRASAELESEWQELNWQDGESAAGDQAAGEGWETGEKSSATARRIDRATASSSLRQRDAVAQHRLKAAYIAATVSIQSFFRGEVVRSAYGSKWLKARDAIRVTTSLLRRVRIKRMSELPLAVGKESGRVVLSAQSEAELANLRLWEQGDEAMYTREALEARYANRSDKMVWQHLNTWWVTAMAHCGLAETASMPKHAYMELCAADTGRQTIATSIPSLPHATSIPAPMARPHAFMPRLRLPRRWQT